MYAGLVILMKDGEISLHVENCEAGYQDVLVAVANSELPWNEVKNRANLPRLNCMEKGSDTKYLMSLSVVREFK